MLKLYVFCGVCPWLLGDTDRQRLLPSRPSCISQAKAKRGLQLLLHKYNPQGTARRRWAGTPATSRVSGSRIYTTCPLRIPQWARGGQLSRSTFLRNKCRKEAKPWGGGGSIDTEVSPLYAVRMRRSTAPGWASIGLCRRVSP